MTKELKVGEFILSKFKYGCVAGVIVEIKRSTAVVRKCERWYNTYTPTTELMNVTKSRIYQIGLGEGETLQGDN